MPTSIAADDEGATSPERDSADAVASPTGVGAGEGSALPLPLPLPLVSELPVGPGFRLVVLLFGCCVTRIMRHHHAPFRHLVVSDASREGLHKLDCG